MVVLGEWVFLMSEVPVVAVLAVMVPEPPHKFHMNVLHPMVEKVAVRARSLFFSLSPSLPLPLPLSLPL